MPNLPDKLHDGDLIKLNESEYPIYIEFVNTRGRGPAWRVYDKYGKGIVLDYEKCVEFYKFLGESLKPEYMQLEAEVCYTIDTEENLTTQEQIPCQPDLPFTPETKAQAL